jgi:hypothetical protein
MLNPMRTWPYVPALAGMVLLLAGCDERPRNPLAPFIPSAPVATYTVYGLISEDTAAGPVPVQGALVALSTSSQRAVTDSTGTYRIAGVSAAKATVLVTRWGFLPNNTAVEIAGDTQRDIQITRAPSFTLSGTTYEMTASGRVPVPGVSVYCDSCGSPDGHTFATTDSEGAYRFDWALNDATPLLVSKSGYRLPAVTDGRIVAIVNGDTRFDIELVRQ